jgi:uncharacterized protein YcbK (DUF882 family)
MKRISDTSLSRRSLLKHALLGGTAALLVPWMSAAAAQARPSAEDLSGRILITHLHTHETLRIRYLDKNGRFMRDALARLDHLFRCHHNGATRPIDPALYLLLDRLHTRLGAGKRPLMLISGYRSPDYNRLLRARGRGVAKQSYHLQGKAADICIKGIDLDRIRQTATRLAQGGVGAYAQFIHVDLGPVRCW